jgi:prepilin-type N-terminal cleavage/methylation domain-containing protein
MKPIIPRRRGFSLIELLIVITIIAVLATVGFTAFNRARESGNRSSATQNLRGNIGNAIQAFAGEYNGDLPSDRFLPGEGEGAPSTANKALEQLLKAGYIQDKDPFVVPSRAARSQQIDSEADLVQLKPGENHWEISSGLRIDDAGSNAIIWENAASGTDSYTPTWNVGGRLSTWGSSWSDNTVIVLTGGGAVRSVSLDESGKVSKSDTIRYFQNDDPDNPVKGLKVETK